MIDTTNMIDISDISNSNIEYADELSRLAHEATEFLRSHKWCKNILYGKLDRGWGYLLAVFYFSIEPAYDSVPNAIWVIVGDVPPAYIDTIDNPNGACAIDGYVMEMDRWVDNVINNRSVAELIPVNVSPTIEYAKMLKSRLDIIKEEILLKLRDEIEKSLNS